MNKTFGYIRVSHKDQNFSTQLYEMQKLNIDERDLFIDKESGKDFNRPQYQALKQIIRPGDLIYVKNIDRLGRNYKEILKEWDELTKEIKVDIKVIDMPLLDTTQYRDLLGDFVSNLILQVLSFVAESERRNIKRRQKEGIALAKMKGIKLGRPEINIPENFPYNYDEWKNGKITANLFMKKMNLKRTTFYKLIKEYEDNGIQLVIK
ncbi:recombinase family protein [Clostridium akagii]|uniref:recombinase family protein n=1 Tax=Clostridium akagii TaxID=91623 RepID=UPI00047B818F|nr:recombinase family protein [Clostridium akagii]